MHVDGDAWFRDGRVVLVVGGGWWGRDSVLNEGLCKFECG
jgi:hypothetical protein